MGCPRALHRPRTDVASRHPDTALVPASNVKMFTAMAALTVWTVGPHRTFDTRAHVVRDDSKGAVLCVHPSGDPTLRPADVDDPPAPRSPPQTSPRPRCDAFDWVARNGKTRARIPRGRSATPDAPGPPRPRERP